MILDLHNYTTQSPNAFDWCMHDPFPIEEDDKANPETEKAANIPEETLLVCWHNQVELIECFNLAITMRP